MDAFDQLVLESHRSTDGRRACTDGNPKNPCSKDRIDDPHTFGLGFLSSGVLETWTLKSLCTCTRVQTAQLHLHRLAPLSLE